MAENISNHEIHPLSQITARQAKHTKNEREPKASNKNIEDKKMGFSLCCQQISRQSSAPQRLCVSYPSLQSAIENRPLTNLQLVSTNPPIHHFINPIIQQSINPPLAYRLSGSPAFADSGAASWLTPLILSR